MPHAELLVDPPGRLMEFIVHFLGTSVMDHEMVDDEETGSEEQEEEDEEDAAEEDADECWYNYAPGNKAALQLTKKDEV